MWKGAGAFGAQGPKVTGPNEYSWLPVRIHLKTNASETYRRGSSPLVMSGQNQNPTGVGKPILCPDPFDYNNLSSIGTGSALPAMACAQPMLAHQPKRVIPMVSDSARASGGEFRSV